MYQRLFDQDWARADVERIIRDAVERKRIYSSLRDSYRVVVLYFRSFAGNQALGNGASQHPIDLQQLPSRLTMLEELNVQCGDLAKFGITDVPLRRDGLIPFILQVAKMLAAHPPDPARFRIFIAEGIEFSAAVRCLVDDQIVRFSQIQDPNHFREIFLRNRELESSRQLRALIAKYEPLLSSFFYDMIGQCAVQTRHSHSAANRHRVAITNVMQTELAMTFRAFVMALRSLSITPTGNRRPSHVDAEGSSASSSTGTVLIDENRAMRVYLQCLDIDLLQDDRLSCKQLTFPQFVEAMLRVALLQNETSICHGGFDVCPRQATSEVCDCHLDLPPYDYAAFNAAFEALALTVRSHRMTHTRRRSSVKVTSFRTLHRGTKARPNARVPDDEEQQLGEDEGEQEDTENLRIITESTI